MTAGAITALTFRKL